MLFSAGDVVKQQQFLDEKPEPERSIAREQLQQMVHYAESAECRRSALLAYFSEEFPDENCGACDNCFSPRETYDGTLHAQKFLSCLYRIRERSGFAVGMNHVIEVLTGADTEKVRKFKHQQLSTYGIGKDVSRSEWGAIGRELIRLGFAKQSSGKFSVLELTEEGRTALSQRRPIQLTKPMKVPERRTHAIGDIACDEVLFEKLRTFRKRLADERGVPPYIIFSDVSLRQMARAYPSNENEFARISGVGQVKLRDFGAMFIREVADFLASNPRQIFADDSFASAPSQPRARLNDTARETLKLFRAGQSVDDIATRRMLATSTIYGHLATAMEVGENIDLDRLLTTAEQATLRKAFAKWGSGNLGGVRESLGNKFDYGILRLYRSALQRSGTSAAS